MKIIVHNEPHAEDNAALQAWYSRSAAGVEAHREKLSKEGSGKFMDRIFIQYGHASVGDLGNTTVYFEGISMLAAKAIQDNPLYNGQECSSRYIDFSEQKFLTGTSEINARFGAAMLFDRMREFYTSSLDPVKADLKLRYPRQETDKEAMYEKAIAAKAFDILRGFLPCGATTNVAWSGTLRNFKERLELMMHHPLKEVQELSAQAYKKLYEAYPHSFESAYALVSEVGLSAAEPGDVFNHLSSIDQFYSDTLVTSDYPDANDLEAPVTTYVRIEGVPLHHDGFQHPRGRAPGRHHPLRPTMYVDGLIDFGSFRDIQRHRGGYCSMPVVDAYEGMHPWYIQQLPESLHSSAYDLLGRVVELDAMLMQRAETRQPGTTTMLQQRIDNQYFMPMGMIVPFTLEYSLRQAIYVAELRSSKTVHPTLRPVAQQMAKTLEDHGVVVHYDDRLGDWTVRRGAQDIVEVESGA